MGKAYAEGKVVEQDYIEAYKWFSLAKAAETLESGCAFNMSAFNALAKQMTPDQIAEAKRRAAARKPTPAPLAAVK